MNRNNFVETGILPLDLITCGKGLPLRRLIHFWSQSGKGTSTVIYTIAKNLIKRGEKVLWVGTEPTQDLAESIGLRMGDKYVKGFKYVDCSFYDDLMSITNAFLNLEGWRLMVIDSLSAVSPNPERIMREGVETNNIGRDIRIQNIFLRTYQALLKETDKSIIYTTHATTKIAIKPGQQTKIVAQGGSSLQDFSALRIVVAGEAMLYVSGMENEKGSKVIGTTGYLMAEKNNHALPFVKIPIAIIFGKGVSNIHSLWEYAQWKGYITGEGRYTCTLDGVYFEQIHGKPALMVWIKNHSKVLLEDAYTNAREYLMHLKYGDVPE